LGLDKRKLGLHALDRRIAQAADGLQLHVRATNGIELRSFQKLIELEKCIVDAGILDVRKRLFPAGLKLLRQRTQVFGSMVDVLALMRWDHRD
ncbi:MAG: hypothetical protein R3284_02330, partial [Rubricoccaceae bacterium]|nr:hypothetical protein [Rubricoccaceae bacterium]